MTVKPRISEGSLAPIKPLGRSRSPIEFLKCVLCCGPTNKAALRRTSKQHGGPTDEADASSSLDRLCLFLLRFVIAAARAEWDGCRKVLREGISIEPKLGETAKRRKRDAAHFLRLDVKERELPKRRSERGLIPGLLGPISHT